MKPDSFLNNEQFVDEINVDNIIPEEEDPKKKKKRIAVIILILVVFCALLATMIYFLKTGSFFFSNKIYASRNLFVVHSSVDFGEKITDFSQYNTYNNAHSYTFFVQNNNNKQVGYHLILIDVNYGDEGVINKKNVSYAIMKNSKKIFKGKLQDKEKNTLIGEKILANQRDDYELKLWVEKNISGYLKYKVIISK